MRNPIAEFVTPKPIPEADAPELLRLEWVRRLMVRSGAFYAAVFALICLLAGGQLIVLVTFGVVTVVWVTYVAWLSANIRRKRGTSPFGEP